MINPSAWIDKYFKTKNKEQIVYDSPNLFYTTIRKTGFIYGHIVSFETTVPIITKGWVQNEIQSCPTKYTLCHLRLSHCDKILIISCLKR
jgi:hypothetical protein